jgi:hypothetical protein
VNTGWALAVVGSLSLALAGCSGADGEATADPDLVLCDGSKDIRLTYVSAGGMVESTYYFLHPLGWSYLLIDGTCHYYVYDGSGPLHAGQLTAEEAQVLGDDLAYGVLGKLPAGSDSCMDAGGVTLTDPISSIGCSCGCSSESTEAVQRRASGYVASLWASGTEKDWELRAARSSPNAVAGVLDWPLRWPPSSLVNVEELPAETPVEGTTISDPEERSQLRGLRTEWASLQGLGEAIAVSSGGVDYGLLLREELPRETADALGRFQSAERDAR